MNATAIAMATITSSASMAGVTLALGTGHQQSKAFASGLVAEAEDLGRRLLALR